VVATREDCYLVGGDWRNQVYNYDNLVNALLTLFYVSSFDGWVDVMFYTIDATAVDVQPVEVHSELLILTPTLTPNPNLRPGALRRPGVGAA
jgi:hypothetical protein